MFVLGVAGLRLLMLILERGEFWDLQKFMSSLPFATSMPHLEVQMG